jgi:hypothetical protein
MTIISTHRNHTYKAASRRRDISPKKVPITTTNYKKTVVSNTTNTTDSLLIFLLTTPTNWIQPIPKPSAPPAAMSTRTIYLWGIEYNVEMPVGLDIYEGLRLWYPNLYKEAMSETEYLNTQDKMGEEEVEEAWAKYEYSEWICDF